MKLIILFFALSFFLGYAFPERLKGREKQILLAGSAAITLLYFGFHRFW